MLNNLKIGLKLPLVMVLIGALSMAAAEHIASRNVRATILASGHDRLLAVAESRAAEVRRTLQMVRSDLRGKYTNPVILEAARAFVTSWELYGPDAAESLRGLYITRNPNPPETRHRLVTAGDRSSFTLVHRRYHPFFTAQMNGQNYSDIYIVSPEGKVVYSSAKTEKFGRNLTDPDLRDGTLSQAFRRVVDGTGFSTDYMTGFRSDAGPGGLRSAVFAMPVRSPYGTTEAVLAIRISSEMLDGIMQRRSGLGRSGIAILLDQDGLELTTRAVRNDPEARARTILSQEAAGAAVSGGKGVLTESGGSDASAVAYTPLNFMGNRIVIAVGQSHAEILATATVLQARMLEDGLVALCFVSVLGLMLARSMSVPLTRVGEAMRRVALRDYDGEIPDRKRRDEIGTIARQLDSFRASLVDAEAVQRENAFKSAAFESASSAMMLVDCNLTIIYVNARLTGLMRQHRIALDRLMRNLRPETIVGRSLSGLFPAIGRSLEAGERDQTFTHRLRLGRTWMEVDLAPVRLREDRILGYVVEWRDVSARYLDGAVLEAVNTRMSIAGFSPDGRVLSSNGAFRDWVGRSEAELLGLNCDRLFHAPAGTAGPYPLWERLTEPKHSDRLWKLRPRSEGAVPCQASLIPVTEDGARLQQYVLLGVAPPAATSGKIQSIDRDIGLAQAIGK